MLHLSALPCWLHRQARAQRLARLHGGSAPHHHGEAAVEAFPTKPFCEHCWLHRHVHRKPPPSFSLPLDSVSVVLYMNVLAKVQKKSEALDKSVVTPRLVSSPFNLQTQADRFASFSTYEGSHNFTGLICFHRSSNHSPTSGDSNQSHHDEC